jgi:hypothetical protein
MMAVRAFEFRTPLKLEEIMEKLTALGPWRWQVRDSETYDDYLATLPDPTHTKTQIIPDGERFVVNIYYNDEYKKPSLSFDEIQRIVLDRLLPAINATGIKDTDNLE